MESNEILLTCTILQPYYFRAKQPIISKHAKKLVMISFKNSILFQTCYISNIKFYQREILRPVLNLRRN